MSNSSDVFVYSALRNALAVALKQSSSEQKDDLFIRQYDGRKYHGLRHLEFMLSLCPYGQYLPEIDIERILFAILFHDYVYVPGDNDNERNSADAFEEFASRHGIENRELVDCVKFAICNSMLCGKQMNLEYFSGLSQNEKVAVLLHDLDFAILGTRRYVYLRYAFGIREEYENKSDYDYLLRRKKFLLTQLSKGSVFCLEFFTNSYGARAKDNILEELKMIEDELRATSYDLYIEDCCVENVRGAMEKNGTTGNQDSVPA